jgi:hypothetical protein
MEGSTQLPEIKPVSCCIQIKLLRTSGLLTYYYFLITPLLVPFPSLSFSFRATLIIRLVEKNYHRCVKWPNGVLYFIILLRHHHIYRLHLWSSLSPHSEATAAAAAAAHLSSSLLPSSV